MKIIKHMESVPNAAGKFLDPGAVIAQIGVERGAVVADFGSGPGYFSVPFAKAVGENGKVYALDVLPQALETVVSKTKNSGITNIVAKRVNLEKKNGSKIESNSVDWVILKDILFQNQEKEVIIEEAYRILKTNGKAIVVEWSQGNSAVGPEREVRVSEDELKKMFIAQKFSIEKDVAAGDFHYAFVVVKS